MTWAWEQDCKPGEKLTLLALADPANEQGHCWPSTARLVEKTGYSRATIFAHFASLEEAGLLWREERTRPDGSRSSSIIHLGVPRPDVGREGPATRTASHPESGRQEPLSKNLQPPHSPPEGGRRRRADPVTPDDDPDFNRVHVAYGRFGGKKEARRAWDVVHDRDDIENIVAGAERWRLYREATPDRNHKYLQGWLSAERWRDDPPPIPRGSQQAYLNGVPMIPGYVG